MAFDLTAQPDGGYPDEYFDGQRGWPDDEFDQSPHFSAKYVRDSSFLPDRIIDSLYGHIEADKAVSLAEDIEDLTHERDSDDPVHLQKLARFAQWLRYWGNRGVDINGGP